MPRLNLDEDVIPLVFNAEWLRGDNETSLALGQVYRDVSFPFKKNEEGYWEYDSNQEGNSVSIKKDNGKGYYLEYRDEPTKNPSGQPEYGFYPLDGTEQETGGTNHNYMFGTKMEIPFTLTKDKTIKTENDKSVPITFDFSGDDVWIYIDGRLVVDLGGTHDTLEAKINFETGEISYSYAKSNNKDKTIDVSQITEEQTEKRKTFLQNLDADEEHTLTMFYMERGLHASNMKISFNFPSENNLTVTNTIDTSNVGEFFRAAAENVGAFNFSLYNQAVSGKKLDVSQAVGGVSLGKSESVNDGTGEIFKEDSAAENTELAVSKIEEDGSNLANSLQYKNDHPAVNWHYASAGDREKRSAVIGIPSGGVDLTDKDYMRMMVYSSEASTTGGRLLFRFEGENGKSYEFTAENAKYDGDNNSLYSGNWNLIRLDLTKVKSAIGNKLSALMVAYSSPVQLNFKDIALYQRVTVNDTLSVINLGTVHSLTNINGRSVNDGSVSVVNGYMIDPDYTNLTSCREEGSVCEYNEPLFGTAGAAAEDVDGFVY